VSDPTFSGYMLAGERIIWSGAPVRGLLFTARDLLMVPFSLMWGGFAIFWESSVVSAGGPPFFLLWGAMFVAVGLFFIVGRFIADAWLRGKTRYALTNQRILIERAGAFGKFTSLNLDRLPDVQLTRNAAGRGTLRFGTQTSMWGGNSFGYWMPTLDPTPQFLAIDDAEHVFAQIQQSIRRRT
jgi:hypothetical protein